MRTKTIFLISFLVILAFFSISVAQMAEPMVIKFKKGSTSKTIKGYIQKTEEAQFSFEANENQTVTVVIKSIPDANIVLVSKHPDYNDLKLIFDGKNKYSGTLTEKGEYFLAFQGKNKSIKRTDFSFTITIK